MFQAYLGFRPRIFFVSLRPIVIVGQVSPRSVLCQSRWSGMIYWRANRMPTFELFNDHLVSNLAKYSVVWNNATPSCWFFISSLVTQFLLSWPPFLTVYTACTVIFNFSQFHLHVTCIIMKDLKCIFLKIIQIVFKCFITI